MRTQKKAPDEPGPWNRNNNYYRKIRDCIKPGKPEQLVARRNRERE